MTQIADIQPGDLVKATKGENSIIGRVANNGKARVIEAGGIEFSLHSLRAGGYTFETVKKYNRPLPSTSGLYASAGYQSQQLGHLPLYQYSSSKDEWTDVRTGFQVVEKAQAVHNTVGLIQVGYLA